MEKRLQKSLIPEHAAEDLRNGNSIKQMLHKAVTIFFADVVGFSSIRKQKYPWDVINMLNRQYCIMDYLVGRLNLHKVESIGDAYVCCSSFPERDDNHVTSIANFSTAVSHCCKQVVSPIDNSTSIQLRIGIHSGECENGIVGSRSPRYFVFGDNVKTEARHESTGDPGKIHCSFVTQQELEMNADRKYTFIRRGAVEMKG